MPSVHSWKIARMPKIQDARHLTPHQARVLPLIEDADELTPTELRQECAAMAEELKKRSWLESSPSEIAHRVPTSVFAIAGTEASDS